MHSHAERGNERATRDPQTPDPHRNLHPVIRRGRPGAARGSIDRHDCHNRHRIKSSYPRGEHRARRLIDEARALGAALAAGWSGMHRLGRRGPGTPGTGQRAKAIRGGSFQCPSIPAARSGGQDRLAYPCLREYRAAPAPHRVAGCLPTRRDGAVICSTPRDDAGLAGALTGTTAPHHQRPDSGTPPLGPKGALTASRVVRLKLPSVSSRKVRVPGR